MPRIRKKNSDDESEYEEEETPESEEDDFVEEEEKEEDAHEEEDNSDDESSEKKPPAKPLARKTNKRKLLDSPISSDYDDDDNLPSYARQTERGGYAHTKLARLKISRANRGNKPWNKGKNRSVADKARISAGVRARNRAILLEKLKKLGMTEEEWFKKKKEIAYIRERVRLAKLVNAKKEKGLSDRRKAEASTLVAVQSVKEESEPSEEESEEAEEEEEEESDVVLEENEGIEDEEKNEAIAEESTGEAGQNPPTVNRIFAREIVWKPHPYDSEEPRCPRGGPGGLICCEVCAANYSRYLTSTCRDMEEQKNLKVGKEMSQLLGFMKVAKTRLGQSVRAARRKPPPVLRPAAMATAGISTKPMASIDATGDTSGERAVI